MISKQKAKKDVSRSPVGQEVASDNIETIENEAVGASIVGQQKSTR